MYQVPTDCETFTKRNWERLVRNVSGGVARDGLEEFGYLPATARFALTTPALLPRVAKVDGTRPSNFLTTRYLDLAALPDNADTFELTTFTSPKDPEWLALAEKENAKTWAYILDAFATHRDREYCSDPAGESFAATFLSASPCSSVWAGKAPGSWPASSSAKSQA
jgi:hypothetical protein